MKGVYKAFFTLIFLAFVSGIPAAHAQNVNQQNFSNIQVDDLSDDQIRQFMRQVQASGLSMDQLEQVAQARGMSPDQIDKLRDRVDKLQGDKTGRTGRGNQDNSSRKNRGETGSGRGRQYNYTDADSSYYDSTGMDSIERRIYELRESEKAFLELRSKIFGADLFRNARPTFEPNLRLATPRNYVIGPDDDILLDIYGYSEVSHTLTVTPEGTVNVPNVGVVSVAGLTVEQATARLKSKLSSIYTGIRSGNTSVNVAIGNIRSIKVILTGEVIKPGTYTLPSVATVFNALYSSGGPTTNGSYRKIEVVRSGKRVATLDVYDFLIRGSLQNNITLRDQDVIRILPYEKRVEMVGQVKRPAIYELTGDEKFSDLLQYAGGFNEFAYKARVKVLENTDTERKITDVLANQFETYVPQTGDKFYIDKILDRFTNRVTIDGAVYRPGQYELQQGMTLSQLIKKAEGLRDDAFKSRGYISRFKDDLNTELVSFDVGRILSGQSPDIALKREDIVKISSIFDLREEYKITVEGEVINPGELPFAENMSLEDVIIQSGGFKESATPKRIEVSRRVRNSNAGSTSARVAEVFQLDVNRDLSEIAGDFRLQPFDIVAVRGATGYEVQRQVKIEGEVLFPGFYTVTRKNEKISDLIKRAGGLTALAYTDGASLKRPAKNDTTEIGRDQDRRRLARLQKLQSTVLDTVKLASESQAVNNDYVGIDLTKILRDSTAKQNLLLEDGDVVYVPRQLQTVKVSGEVLSPGSSVFQNGRSFKSYVYGGGGFTERALKRRSYIIYANGSVKSTKKLFFFNNYPRVKPGAEIFVPKKAEKRKITANEVLGLTSGVASLGAIILGIINLTK
ncbi:MAG: SLBB domain-containing protein [Mucilaginibacter polytrichastri]|nr:SLBB domain-containing protein [Mucilaginibacter polytrichastri]